MNDALHIHQYTPWLKFVWAKLRAFGIDDHLADGEMITPRHKCGKSKSPMGSEALQQDLDANSRIEGLWFGYHFNQ